MSSNTEYPKICTHCGAKFIAKKLSTKSCSYKCSQRAYKQKKKDERVAMAVTDIKNQGKPSLYSEENTVQNKPPDKNCSILKEKEYLSVLETSQLMGVTRTTINKYCSTGKLKCIKMNRKIFIRRKDIEELYKAEGAYFYITEWCFIDEITEKYGISKGGVYSLVSAHKVPRKNKSGRNVYSQSHIDELLKDRLGDANTESWCTTEELYEKYGLQPSYVANFVFMNKIPKRRMNGRSGYSQIHFDNALEEKNPPTVYLKIEDAAVAAFKTDARHN